MYQAHHNSSLKDASSTLVEGEPYLFKLLVILLLFSKGRNIIIHFRVYGCANCCYLLNKWSVKS